MCVRFTCWRRVRDEQITSHNHGFFLERGIVVIDYHARRQKKTTCCSKKIGLFAIKSWNRTVNTSVTLDETFRIGGLSATGFRGCASTVLRNAITRVNVTGPTHGLRAEWSGEGDFLDLFFFVAMERGDWLMKKKTSILHSAPRERRIGTCFPVRVIGRQVQRFPPICTAEWKERRALVDEKT